jgi:DNA-binding transcriptional LysR family regulator
MDDSFWAIYGATFVLLWGLIIVLARYLQVRAQLRLREMIHREMILAMEKSVPLPEITSLAELAGTTEALWPRIKRLLPAFSLGVGFVLAGLGVGLAAAFYFAADPGLNKVWTLGLIPLFVGIGFLLYHHLAGRTTA